jgi:hypothetical protein
LAFASNPVPEVQQRLSEVMALRIRAWLDRLEEPPFSSLLATAMPVLAVLLFAATVIFAGSRQLWHDELYTFYIAGAPSLHQLFREIPLDLNPPLEYLTVRASFSLFGHNEYAARLPSMLSFLVASGCLYWFFKRRISSVYGVLAVAVLWSTPFLYYATEARPYALVLAFFSIALLAWCARSQGRHPAASVAVLALAICGMMLSHFFAIFYILPLSLAELVRDYRARKVDFPVWASLLLPLAIPFIFLSIMARYGTMAFPQVYLATWGTILEFFYNTLSPEAWVLLPAICAGIVIALRRGRKPDPAAVPTRLETALVVGLLVIPFAIIAALILNHGSFNNRYAIPTGLGYAMFLAFFVAMYSGSSRLAASVTSLILFGFITLTNILHPALEAWHHFRNPGTQIQSDALVNIDPNLPLVAASGLTFLEMDHYAQPATVARLYYLTDRRLALRYAHATIFESFPKLKRVFPIRASVTPYPQFVSEHPRFLVLGTPDYPEDWLIKRLLDIHATLRYLGDIAGPYKDHQLYEVTMPGGSSPATS